MEEKELKTSTTQRVIIGLIALILIGATIASYAAIVISGSKGNSSSSNSTDGISSEKLAEYEKDYTEKLSNFQKVSADDYNKFISYRSEAKAYNEENANNGGLATRDLLNGEGATLESGMEYLAYYIGWCADETIFDSSLDSTTNPTAFTSAIDASLGLIEGWNQGVLGMKLGGVREITIPGELAYGESREICGGTNKPLKFIVMAVAKEDPLKSATEDLQTAYMRVQYGYYGIDYDDM